MRDQQTDIGGLKAVTREQARADFAHLGDRVFEDLLAFLMNVVHFVVDGFGAGRPATAPRGHVQVRRAGAVHFAHEIDEARVFVLRGGFHNHCARAIAKQNAGGAVLVVDDAAHGVSADDQNLAMQARGYEARARREAVDETAAGRDQIEAPRVGGADILLHQADGGREQHIRRHGADDDGIDLTRIDAPLRKGDFGRTGREIRGGDVGFGNVALRYAGAAQNPFIVGFDELLEIRVGEDARRNIAAHGCDFCSDWRHRFGVGNLSLWSMNARRRGAS